MNFKPAVRGLSVIGEFLVEACGAPHNPALDLHLKRLFSESLSSTGSGS